LSGWAKPFATAGQCPVMPRYSRGVDDAAKSAPTTDRRDAPTSGNSAPLPSASRFSASFKEVVRSYKRSASILVLSKRACCVPAWHARYICFTTVPRLFWKNCPAVSPETLGWEQATGHRSPPALETLRSLQIERSAAIDDGHSRLNMSGTEHTMGKPRHSRGATRLASTVDGDTLKPNAASALDENFRRSSGGSAGSCSPVRGPSGWIACTARTGPVLARSTFAVQHCVLETVSLSWFELARRTWREVRR
jgi:hypothetical protein